MIQALVALAALLDAALAAFVVARLVRARRRGVSLRLRIFVALGLAAMCGALATGLVAIAPDVVEQGARVVFARIAGKAFLVGSAIAFAAAGAASVVGRLLSRSIEELAVTATRLAAGDDLPAPSRVADREARQLARALASMRREIAGQPHAAGLLRDAWHDLKTPVAAIKATVEVLQDGALDDRATSARLLENVRRSSDRLEHMLSDWVTLARYRSAALARDEATSVRALVEAAVEATRPLAEARRANVSVTGAQRAQIHCDPVAIQRALTTLVINAVEASPEGRVEVEIAPTAGRVAIELRNEPASIVPELRGRLFERGATSRGHAGSGLGLAIARAAIEAHGGDIAFVELGPPRVVVRVELP